ncbi:MAG: glycosyltransferase family 2 protein [Puniceicoccaceae bacterium]
MKASVVIPVRNGGDLFRRCLDAVLGQRFAGEWELVVADTESTDGSLDLVRSRSAGGPPVRWFSVPPGEFGHGRTRNQLIDHAHGEFVALLTQDAVPGTDSWLRELVETLEAYPEAAGVFGRHVSWPEHGPFIAGATRAHFAGFGPARTCFRLAEGLDLSSDPARRGFLRYYSDNNSALRKSVWRELPYPDVPFGEDQLWAERILEAGYAKAYTPEAWVYHSHRYGFRPAVRRARIEADYYAEVFGDFVGAPLRPSLRNAWRTVRSQWRSMRGADAGGVRERLLSARDVFALHLGHHLSWRSRRPAKKEGPHGG